MQARIIHDTLYGGAGDWYNCIDVEIKIGDSTVLVSELIAKIALKSLEAEK